MFEQHQPRLSELGRSNADGFTRICTFALLTIRQPLRIACMDYKLVRRGDDRALFGSKRNGVAYLRQHAAELLEACEYSYATADDEMAETLIVAELMKIPGIGTAKAGFICQMIYGLSGCIDTHNITRFGISEKTFYVDKSKPNAVRRLRDTVRDYNSFCRKVGGTAALWDGWCDYLAARDPLNYHSGEFVSSLHLVPLEC